MFVLTLGFIIGCVFWQYKAKIGRFILATLEAIASIG